MHSLCGQGPALATQRLLRKYAQMKARILKYTWNYGMISLAFCPNSRQNASEVISLV